MDKLQIILEEVKQKTILRVKGRLDVTSAPHFEKKIEPILGKRDIWVDLGGVHYLSSAGIRALLTATKKADALKKKWVLFSLNQEVYEIICMAGFDQVLHLCANETEALEYIPREIQESASAKEAPQIFSSERVAVLESTKRVRAKNVGS
jgi:anti-anti-sigma factor